MAAKVEIPGEESGNFWDIIGVYCFDERNPRKVPRITAAANRNLPCSRYTIAFLGAAMREMYRQDRIFSPPGMFRRAYRMRARER